MAQSNIGIKFNVDVSQGKSQVNDLSNTIADLNNKIVQATNAGDWRAVAQLTQAMNNATSARGQIMNQVKQQNPQAQQNMANAIMQNGAFIMFQSALSQLSQSIVKTAEAFHSAKVQKLSGDYMGAHISETRAKGELAGDVVGTGLSAILGVVFKSPQLAAAAMSVLNPLLKHAFGYDARQAEITAAGSQQYKNVLPHIDTLNQLFGGAVDRKSAEENNRYGLSMYSKASEAASGTGLSTQDFIDAMKEAGKFGNITETQARNMAQTQALWSRFTGTDLSAIQKYAGTAYRYGGETNATSTAYGGLMASNMGKGQFSEFLTSMGRIMEEGIAKGFVRSSEEIAGNMTMLYKLSGGSKLWQGEQGAQRLSQMNSAIANATNLQSVEDVISFSVAREILGIDDPETEENEREKKFIAAGKDPKLYTGTYVDEQLLLEHGVSANLLKGQFEAINKLEGNNTAGIIERFKTMFGLNYHGATEVWSMYKNSMVKNEDGTTSFNFNAKQFEEDIKRFTKDPRMQSDSQLLQDSLNRINVTLASIGSMEFAKELKVLEKTQSDVAAILAHLKGEKDYSLPNLDEISLTDYEKLPESVREDAKALKDAIAMTRGSPQDRLMFVGRNTGRHQSRGYFDLDNEGDKEAHDRLIGLRDSFDNPEKQKSFIDVLNYLKELTPEQRALANDRDAINKGIEMTPDTEVHRLLQNIIDTFREMKIVVNVEIPS
ncbi:MAG: hypothetical protein FWB73_00390 [Treponema sp.]|nr:hypothetical protein [Treponema sp.]